MSQTRMEGYTSDISYTPCYLRKLDPEFINYSAVMHGREPITLEKGFTHCDLGCGRGLTSLIMAANHPQGEFWATDYSPFHIEQAQKLAEEAGLTNIHFLELSFQELVDNPSLVPPCDFITLHGIYTWVNDENRQHVTSILTQNLKPGGFVYNSYNAMPGWAAIAPLQTAFNELSHVLNGASTERFTASRNFISSFRKLNPNYFERNQQALTERLNIIDKCADINYLIHEYLNDGWKAFHFHEVSRQMASAELEYIGQDSPAESYAHGLMSGELQQQLSLLPSIELQQMFKDMTYNTNFRMDLYTKGAQHIDTQQQLEWLQQQQWQLVPAKIDTFTFKLSVGLSEGKHETYMMVVDALKPGPTSFEELLETTQFTPAMLAQVLAFLYHADLVAISNKTSPQGAKLNQQLALQPFSPNQNVFSAPGIKAGISLNTLDLKILQHYFESTDTAPFSESLAQTLPKKMDKLELSLSMANKKLSGKSMEEKLLKLAQTWETETKPVWKRIGII